MSESFKQLLEETGFYEDNLNTQGIRMLEVTNVTNKHVFVEVGMKAQGVIPTEEFKRSKKDNIGVVAGDEIPVFIDAYDNGYGQPIISYTKARIELNKQDILKSLSEKEFFLNVFGSHATRVGIVASYNGTDVFVPYTLLGFDSNPKEYYDEQFLGTEFKVKVIKADFHKNHVVVSHKSYLESERGLSFDKLVKDLVVGEIYEVPLNRRKFKNYGVFTTINHIDTLLKVNDISWKNISDPADYFTSETKTTKVMLTHIDLEQERITVSHKLANTEEWDNFVKNHSEQDIISVKVVSIKDDYMLVRFNDEIDFMLHQNEISDQQISGSIGMLYSIGDEIQAIIKQISIENKKINLTVKGLNDQYADIKVGDIKMGKILSKNENGIKVGSDKLVFWIPKREFTEGYNQQELLKSFKENKEVEFRITSINNGSYQGSLILESNLPHFNKGDKVSDFKVLSLEKGKVLVGNEDGFKGFINIISNVKISPKDLFEEDEVIKDLMFKSIDKNNYFHFDYFVEHNNQFENPKLGDVFKQ